MAHAALSVAIIRGGFYAADLKNNLVAAGINVTELSSYTAATLSAYNAVITYGNMAQIDITALQTYATNGGCLIWTPWAGYNFEIPGNMQIFGTGSNSQYNIAYPGVTVLKPGDALLNGVTFAAGSNIGRIQSTFVAGVTQVANWSDGYGMIGYRSIGTGTIIGINMHVITSDCAYTVINQPWAIQLFLNAVGFNGPTYIELLYFRSQAKLDHIHIIWETATEFSNAGFHIWRSESKDGEYAKMTELLIPSQGTTTSGASYEYYDFAIVSGTRYWYKLEDLDVNGVNTFHEPVQVSE